MYLPRIICAECNLYTREMRFLFLFNQAILANIPPSEVLSSRLIMKCNICLSL